MHSYADAEYERGLYRDYVEAREMKLAHFRSRMDSVSARIPKGRLLDVGCSCGYFLEVAVEHGYEVRGLEFSESAIAAAVANVRGRIVRAGTNQLRGEYESSYDVITAFDIIEHLEDPRQFLGETARLLRPNGALVISTPDAEHMLRYLMASRWPMLQPMQHLTIFSRRALQIALVEAGFGQIVLAPAHKLLSFDYLISQVRTLNPGIHSVLRAATKVMPRHAMSKYRQLNIGELLVIAKKLD
jgi:2-polyprenyl-3-methyl-5-hydroxy-6-metoxy-1,4-benzoquinol methylase